MSITIYRSVGAGAPSNKRMIRMGELVLETIRERDIDVSIQVVGEAKMRRLNRAHRGKDHATDVLAFAMRDGERMDASDWGDVFLCPAVIRRQAKEHGVAFEEEFVRTLIHGMLHLAGYDHERRAAAKRMFRLQERILGQTVRKVQGSRAFINHV